MAWNSGSKKVSNIWIFHETTVFTVLTMCHCTVCAHFIHEISINGYVNYRVQMSVIY